MAMRTVSRRPWYVNAAGTRYVRDSVAPRTRQEPLPILSKILDPILKGEAAGDHPLAVLLAVRNVIRTKDTYTGAARARNSMNAPTEPTSEMAVCWSVIGAVDYVTHPTSTSADRRVFLDMIKRALPKDVVVPLFRWEENAKTKHSQVLHLMNMAIALRKKEIGCI